MARTQFPIQKKAVNILFWVFTMVLGGVSIYHFWTLATFALERAESETLNVATALKEFTIRQVTSTDVQLTHLIENPIFQKALESKNEKILHEFLKKMVFLQDPPEEYFVIDEVGVIRASSRQYPVKQESFQRAKFFSDLRDTATKEIYLGQILPVHDPENYEVPLVKRLSLKDGYFGGIVGMFLNPKAYQSFYQHLRLQPDDSIALLDKDGRFIMRYPWRKDIVGKKTTNTPELIASVENIPVGNRFLISSVDGKKRLVSFINIEKIGLLALSARTNSMIYANIWKSVYLLVPIYFGLVWLAFYLSRAFLRSEFRLRNEVEKAVLFEETLKTINSYTSKEIGLKFLETLVNEMSKVLKCHYVYVAEVSEDRLKAMTVAFSNSGKIVPNVEYSILNTPCEGVLKEEVCIYARSVQKGFPDDKMLLDYKVESYIGISLFDFRGEVIGLLVGFSDEPMRETDLIMTVFNIFAARAGAEIERLRSERSRLQAEEIKRNLETQSAQSQKMESMGRLASGIAHDFNNVLTAIVANLEFARIKLSDRAATLDYINRAEKASERARDLVRQILTFNRKSTQETKPLQLSNLIQEVSEILRAGIGAHIEIRTVILDYDLMIYGNATQIHQVIMNLCANAAQAITGPSGLIEIILEQLDDEALLTVRDNGCGMDDETIQRIFEPFFTTKQPGQGTGLGLSVVQGIVKNHGGSIEVRSKPQKGSEFVVHFPLYVQKTVADGVRKTLDFPKGQGQNILVVDDESTMVELTCDFLSDYGYKTIGFSYPQQAIDAFLAEPGKFSLVITDLTMPVMKGDELARRIREIRKDIPVIFTSGLDTELSQLQKIGGPYLTLQKPYNLWALVEAVGKFLRPPAEINH